MLQAIRTRVLPGISVNGNYRVAVYACAGKFQRVMSVPSAYGRGGAHLEACRKAIPMLGDGWQGDYAGGAFDGDVMWVHMDARTPHTELSSLTLTAENYLGQSA
jgi:hypothetical protein